MKATRELDIRLKLHCWENDTFWTHKKRIHFMQESKAARIEICSPSVGKCTKTSLVVKISICEYCYLSSKRLYSLNNGSSPFTIHITHFYNIFLVIGNRDIRTPETKPRAELLAK